MPFAPEREEPQKARRFDPQAGGQDQSAAIESTGKLWQRAIEDAASTALAAAQETLREDTRRALEEVREAHLKAAAETEERLRAAFRERIAEEADRVAAELGRELVEGQEGRLKALESRFTRVSEERIAEVHRLAAGHAEASIRQIEERIGDAERGATERLRRTREIAGSELSSIVEMLTTQLEAAGEEQFHRISETTTAQAAGLAEAEVKRLLEGAEASLRSAADEMLDDRLRALADTRFREAETQLAAARDRILAEVEQQLGEMGADRVKKALAHAEAQLRAEAEKLTMEQVRSTVDERVEDAVAQLNKAAKKYIVATQERAKTIIGRRAAAHLEAERKESERQLRALVQQLGRELEQRVDDTVEQVRSQTEQRLRRQADLLAG